MTVEEDNTAKEAPIASSEDSASSEGGGGRRGSGGRRRPGSDGEPPRKMGSMRGTEYLLTYPQFECDRAILLDFIKSIPGVQAAVVCCEEHKKTKTGKHMHVAIKFDERARRAPEIFTFQDRRPNIKLLRWGSAVRYTIKEDQEPATYNVDLKAFAQRRKALTMIEAAAMSPTQLASEVPAHQYRSVVLGTYMFRDETAVPLEMTSPKGIWIQGTPGAGKTFIRRLIERAYGFTPYSKSLNKWWDRYQQEQIVIIDEVSKGNAAWIGDFLKIWADEYGSSGEIKGGRTPLSYRVLIVTSNYHIEELWGDDTSMIEAIDRRFMRFTMSRDTREQVQAEIMEEIDRRMKQELFDINTIKS